MNLSSIWFKELNPSFAKKSKTHRVEYDSKRLNPFKRYVSKNCSSSLNMSHRIVLFFNMTQRIVTFLKICFKELTSFFEKKKNWTFKKMTQRFERFFLFDVTQKNWTFFFLEKMTLRIEPFWKVWLEEYNLFYMTQWIEPQNLFFEYDSKKWTLLNTTQRSEPFLIRLT